MTSVIGLPAGRMSGREKRAGRPGEAGPARCVVSARGVSLLLVAGGRLARVERRVLEAGQRGVDLVLETRGRRIQVRERRETDAIVLRVVEEVALVLAALR